MAAVLSRAKRVAVMGMSFRTACEKTYTILLIIPTITCLKSGCAVAAAALLLLPLPGRRYCTPPPLQLLLLTTAAPAHLFRPPGFAERTAVVLVQITKLASLEEGRPRLDSSCKAIKNLPQRSYPLKVVRQTLNRAASGWDLERDRRAKGSAAEKWRPALTRSSGRHSASAIGSPR